MSDEDRIARVARALCVADRQDLEAEISVGTDVVEDDGGERYHEITAPAWTAYVGEARQMIAAVRAWGCWSDGVTRCGHSLIAPWRAASMSPLRRVSQSTKTTSAAQGYAASIMSTKGSTAV